MKLWTMMKTIMRKTGKCQEKKVDIKPGKIYVGKLPDSGVGEDEIKEHFSQFGTVSQVIRPIDWRKDNTPKNFCFVTFEKERVAKKLIEEGTCDIGGHKIQIKKVPSRPRDQSTRGGRGGYGGSPWMKQGGGWGNDCGYGGFGGQGGGQLGNDGGYGGGDKGQGGWGQVFLRGLAPLPAFMPEVRILSDQ